MRLSGEMQIYMPWQMIFYLVAGLVCGVVVSLLTKPVDKERLDNFYALIRTPIAPDEKIETPCTLPVGSVVPEKRNFFPNTNLEIPIPTRTTIVGFLVGWVVVAVIVLAVYMIANG